MFNGYLTRQAMGQKKGLAELIAALALFFLHTKQQQL